MRLKSRARAQRRLLTAGVVLISGVMGLVAMVWPRPDPVPAADACSEEVPDRLTPSRDLYCVELIPATGVESARGHVALQFGDSPFTQAVTPDGRPRFQAVVTLSGLPPADSLGAYVRYVAWAATPVMYPIERLGDVTNGTTTLGPIEFNKFVVIITAEPEGGPADEWRGRLVLRGQSPSTRMLPPDLLEFSLGSESLNPSDTDDSPWTRSPPVTPGLMMLPAMMSLRPRVTPYLPPTDSALPRVLPREVIQLADGDTLTLRARLVERTLKGRTMTMMAFNGQHPGPLLVAPRGATVVVDFSNDLDWPTTVHWHGIRLDNRSDGVPGVTQDPVPPGGSFLYTVLFPDAGIYWYHPHLREDVQQELGLYGNMLVRSPEAEYFSPAHREEIVVLDDILLDEVGAVPFGLEGATHALMGRFGNVFLVNGEPEYELAVHRGEVVRFFLTNVSNTRTFNLSFPGARLKLVGSDVGNFEREAWVESVIIAPAERYIVHVQFPREGIVPLVNQVQAIDHVNGWFLAQSDTLGTIRVAGTAVEDDLDSSFAQLREDRSVQRELAPFRPSFAGPPDFRLLLTMETRDLPFVMERLMRLDSAYFNPVEWSGTMPMMNWVTDPSRVRWILRDPDTGRENMDIDWRFRVGDVVKVRLANDRGVLHAMQHPIHLHGQRFLVLRVNGRPSSNLVWKDTVLLPVGTTADILVEMSNPGRWVVHCHIAEHLESGMHMVFTVE